VCALTDPCVWFVHRSAADTEHARTRIEQNVRVGPLGFAGCSPFEAWYETHLNCKCWFWLVAIQVALPTDILWPYCNSVTEITFVCLRSIVDFCSCVLDCLCGPTDPEVPGSIPGHYKEKESSGAHSASWVELGRHSSGSGLEIREYGHRDSSCWPRGTLYQQKSWH
jgi:hypothetical protein